jgi:hypothetical protein
MGSRILLGQDLSGVAPSLVQKGALALSGVLEKLGIPLQVIKGQGPGTSTLGVRPGTQVVKAGQKFLSDFLNKTADEGTLRAEPPVIAPEVTPEVAPAIPPTTPAPAPAPAPAPEAVAPAAAPTPDTALNIRVGKAKQVDFAARRRDDEDSEAAAAKRRTGHHRSRQKSRPFGRGEARCRCRNRHRGVIAEGEAGTPRAEQEAAYVAENLGAAPETIRERYQKFSSRFDGSRRESQLIAMSLDKVTAT